uniref:RNA polymerase II-associated protein 3 n=1 Tax=Noccaea caerulescens TaxID=107243 RepID=A0A1J3FL78_NOCCA
MARSPSKHGRDQTQDFEGFLNDLQDWELSLKDKDKKIKHQPANSSNPISEKLRPRVGSGQYDFAKNYDFSSGSLNDDETLLDANSEKEQGNEYFKQKKFNEAIDCYSRSIALSPNAVAFANRAMAYLKIKRYREAEVDCTEALNMDDRYIKAYSRRATARKELGMLKEAKEDAEFALRLEPQSQELKKQYAEIKSLLEKEIIEKATGAMQSTAQELLKKAGLDKKTKTSNAETCLKPVTLGSKTNKESSKKKIIESVQPEERNKQGSAKVPAIKEHVDNSKKATPRSQSSENIKPSVQELAARAASLAMAEVSKNIKAPKSAYEFENSWRSFSGDRTLQNQLLKVTTPSSLPEIFKNALTSPVLVDIIKSVASFFREDMDLGVKYIENLTKVPRFNMLVMCLTSTEKNELMKIWEDVFCNKATPMEYAEVLDKLRSRYCLQQ